MRLIDAEALIQDIKDHKIPFNADINEAIVCAPTIDAVEVVRCKDCKRLMGNEQCLAWTYEFLPADGYCYLGKRRDDEISD